MRFVEDAALSGVRLTNDGYLVAEVRCARTGVQQYTGSEVGRPEIPVVNVYRPEEAVFAKDSLRSFAGKPITDNHPDEFVTADNWKKLAVGSIGGEVLRDGEYVRVSVMLMDQAVIDKVKAGKRELSMGYTHDMRWESGTAPDGTAYDAVMNNFRMNHLAVVDAARAGHECRIGDGAQSWGAAPIHIADEKGSQMTDKLRNVMVDGIPVETTDQGAAAIEKLQNDKKAAEELMAGADEKHEAAIAEKDKELAAKDAEIADLKKKILDDAAVDAKVQARAALITDAKKLAKDAKFDGLSDAEIRKAAVVAVHGEDAIKGKSDAYIEAAFDLALKAADAGSNDTVRAALKSRDASASNENDNGQTAYEKRLTDGWKNETKEA
ncbi:MAG: hypothetical protein A49_08590 [Methyloceanibacter sp.]|nr:MAG: hypothetical protein A49_08590 [Methyloceanibacter sp.]